VKYDEAKAKELIDDRIAITERAWSQKRDLWSEIYSMYRFYTDQEPEVIRGERSNIFVPIAFSIVETKLPRVVQSLLSLDPWFAVEGRNSKDHANADFMTAVLQYSLDEEINAFYPLVMWWKEAMMYGNSFMYVGWEREVAELKKRMPINYGTEVIGYDFSPQPEVVYDGITLNHLDIFDCFPAPYGTRINGRSYERMPYFILRSEPNAEYLKRLGQMGVFDAAKVEEVIRRYPQGSGEIDRYRTDRMGKSRMVSENTDKRAPRFEMYTMFENDWWVTKIEDVVLRNRENPFGDNKIPIVSALDTPVPHEFFGIGQIEPIIKLQYYINDIENLKLDFLMKCINPGSLISKDNFIDPQAFMRDPDGIHVVRGNPSAAYSLVQRPNANAFNSTQEQVNIERYIDKVLGQSDISRGVSKAGANTATEVVALIEQANFRFDLSVRLLKNESLVPMLEMCSSRIQQFWPFEKEVKLYDEDGSPEFLRVPVSNLIGNWRFKIKTSPARGNKQAFAQTLLRFLDVLGKDQGQHPELVTDIARYLEISDPERYSKNPAKEALATIVQAANEGLLQSPQQAALVLSEVMNKLAPAPAGTPGVGSIPGSMPENGNEEDMARRMGSELGAANRGE
jgi:hypothetical protein